jgi:peptide/nickel transport system ATP-binding protein
VPRLDAPGGAPLHPIPGSPTDIRPWAQGCAFSPRCGNRIDPCTESPPVLEEALGRSLRCYNPLMADEEVPA